MLYGQNLLGQNNSVSKVKLSFILHSSSVNTWATFFFSTSQFQLRPTPPPPPAGYCGAFACLVSPEGGAFVGGVTRPMLRRHF